MKIDSSTRTTPLAGTATAPSRSSKATPQGARGSAGQDNVDISSVSTQIHAIESSIAEASGFDAAKVEEIKLAISEGRFHINADLIADKLITSARELALQQRKG